MSKTRKRWGFALFVSILCGVIGLAWVAGPRFLQAQVAQRVVASSEVQGPQSVHAADLDGDGWMDVLSASQRDDKIAWYRNEGEGTFSGQKVLSTEARGARAVYAADLNGDGQTDVLSASGNDNKIAWYRNEGDGTFSDQKVLGTGLARTETIYAADLDGDGRTDVLSASHDTAHGAEKIVWYRNEGEGTFSDQRVISTVKGKPTSVHAADVDGDGEIDVLSAAYGFEAQIAWYKNEGGRHPFGGGGE